MIEFLLNPWPWYFSGVVIVLVMFLLLLFGKAFGVSSTLRTFCAIAGAGKKFDFFRFEWKSQVWNLVFILGAGIGGFIAVTFLNGGEGVQIASETYEDLASIGIPAEEGLMPTSIFNFSNLFTLQGFFLLVGGGFLVGFGTRWAGGCTSGHAISGLSNLQLPSLIAVVGFFIGGLIMTHFLFPILF